MSSYTDITSYGNIGAYGMSWPSHILTAASSLIVGSDTTSAATYTISADTSSYKYFQDAYRELIDQRPQRYLPEIPEFEVNGFFERCMKKDEEEVRIPFKRQRVFISTFEVKINISHKTVKIKYLLV